MLGRGKIPLCSRAHLGYNSLGTKEPKGEFPMTVKELEAAFTAAAENTMQKAEALGLEIGRASCRERV